MLQTLGTAGWWITMISSKADPVDRVMQWYSYVHSDAGQIDMMMGTEGVHWDYVGGVPMKRQEIFDMERDDPDLRTAVHGSGVG